ncbi:MAG TPA: hypothetical protein PK263_05550, partial [bacterium]|nr:hypothetical protein [bacterium]
MKGKKGAKTIAITLLMLIISIAAGLLMSAQLRSIPTRVSDPILPFSSLRETKEELYTEQAQLKAEITALQDSIQDAQTQNESAVLSKNEISDLNNKKALAGLTKLSGPGVGIILDDS